MDEHRERKDRMVIGSIAILLLIIIVIFTITMMIFAKLDQKYGSKISAIFIIVIVLSCIWYAQRQPTHFT